MNREIILDTETTGLNPFQGDKIIEIAAIELIDHISTEKKFHCYINPERDIPETSQQIHNISYEMVKDKPIFKDIIDEFLSFIKNDNIIIHNADFDLAFFAVKQNGLSINFVDGDLKKNKKIIIEAIKQNRESYDFIDSSMKLDKDVSAAFMKYSMI